MTTPRPLLASLRPSLRAVAAEWVSAWRPLLDAAGLEVAEGVVLSALWDADGATEADLARRVLAPREVVRDCVEGLRLLGYAEREEEPEGVWLTQEGYGLRERAAQVFVPTLDVTWRG